MYQGACLPASPFLFFPAFVRPPAFCDVYFTSTYAPVSMVVPYRSALIFRVEFNCVCLASLTVILKFCRMIVRVFPRVSLLHVLVVRIAMIFLVIFPSLDLSVSSCFISHSTARSCLISFTAVSS